MRFNGQLLGEIYRGEHDLGKPVEVEPQEGFILFRFKYEDNWWETALYPEDVLEKLTSDHQYDCIAVERRMVTLTRMVPEEYEEERWVPVQPEGGTSS